MTSFLPKWLNRAATFLDSTSGAGRFVFTIASVPLGGGTVTGTLSVTRGRSATIGEAVEFYVDSLSGFTVSEGPYVAYDPLDHEVEWRYTITPPEGGGEPTTWQASSRNVSVNKNRLKAYGRRAFFVPLDATGTYTVAVEGRDGFGNVFTDSTTFDVVSWDSLSAPSRTYIIYDGVDLTGAPDHDPALRYTSLADAYNHADGAGSAVGFCRFAILGGYTSPAGIGSVRGWHNPTTFLIHSYGTGRGRVSNEFIKLRTAAEQTVIAQDIDIISDPEWDMAQGGAVGVTSYGVGVDFADFIGWGTWSRCTFRGFGQSFSCLTGNPAAGIWCEEVSFEDHLDYDIYTQVTGQRMGFRGCNIGGPSDLLVGGARGAGAALTSSRTQHGNFRSATPMTLIADGNQWWAANGWSYGSSNWPAHQPNIRFNMSGGNGGGNLFFTRNLVEGPGIRGNSNVTSSANNLLIECNVFLSTTQGNAFSCDPLNHTGWTLRNNIYLGSSATRDPGSTPQEGNYRTGVSLKGSDETGNTDPIRAHFNTCVDLLSGDYTADHCGIKATPVTGNQSTLTAEANLAYAPNYTTALEPDGSLVAQTGVTVHGTFGSCMGWTVEPYSAGLAIGATSAAIPWFDDIDGNPVNGSTFSGGLGNHLLHEPSGNDTSSEQFAVTLTDLEDGTFTLTNTSGRTVPASNHLIQLDRRHDKVVFPGSASPSTAGQFYAPASNVAASGLTLPTPYWDFFGNVRSGAACKGAIHVAA